MGAAKKLRPHHQFHYTTMMNFKTLLSLSTLAIIPAAACVPIDGTATADEAEPAITTAADSLRMAATMCRVAVEDKLTSPKSAKFAAIKMRRHEGTGALAGRSTVDHLNGVGVEITTRYVCLVEGNLERAGALFRSTEPEMYAETVRLFGLEG